MMKMFSVVIPLYNKENHIVRTINSVLSQILMPFEIIIVNDGSTDNSLNAVSELKNVDRVKIISQMNLGVSAARNRGVDESAGKYVVFLDADDEWLPWHLHELDSMIKDFPDCGIYSVAHFIMQDGIKYYPNTGVDKTYRGFIKDVFDVFGRGLALVNSSTACVSREAFYRAGGFPFGITRGEDVYLWLKIAASDGLAHSARVCVQYNKDAENRSDNKVNVEVPYYLKYLDTMQSNLKSKENMSKAMLILLYKGIIYTAAGFRVAGSVEAINALSTLKVVNKSFFLQFLLFILKVTPRWMLLLLRKRRHSKAVK
jgi:glycosyltransferase involved in cell wall biosynthesis